MDSGILDTLRGMLGHDCDQGTAKTAEALVNLEHARLAHGKYADAGDELNDVAMLIVEFTDDDYAGYDGYGDAAVVLLSLRDYMYVLESEHHIDTVDMVYVFDRMFHVLRQHITQVRMRELKRTIAELENAAKHMVDELTEFGELRELGERTLVLH